MGLGVSGVASKADFLRICEEFDLAKGAISKPQEAQIDWEYASQGKGKLVFGDFLDAVIDLLLVWVKSEAESDFVHCFQEKFSLRDTQNTSSHSDDTSLDTKHMASMNQASSQTTLQLDSRKTKSLDARGSHPIMMPKAVPSRALLVPSTSKYRPGCDALSNLQWPRSIPSSKSPKPPNGKSCHVLTVTPFNPELKLQCGTPPRRPALAPPLSSSSCPSLCRRMGGRGHVPVPRLFMGLTKASAPNPTAASVQRRLMIAVQQGKDSVGNSGSSARVRAESARDCNSTSLQNGGFPNTTPNRFSNLRTKISAQYHALPNSNVQSSRGSNNAGPPEGACDVAARRISRTSKEQAFITSAPTHVPISSSSPWESVPCAPSSAFIQRYAQSWARTNVVSVEPADNPHIKMGVTSLVLAPSNSFAWIPSPNVDTMASSTKTTPRDRLPPTRSSNNADLANQPPAQAFPEQDGHTIPLTPWEVEPLESGNNEICGQYMSDLLHGNCTSDFASSKDYIKVGSSKHLRSAPDLRSKSVGSGNQAAQRNQWENKELAEKTADILKQPSLSKHIKLRFERTTHHKSKGSRMWITQGQTMAEKSPSPEMQNTAFGGRSGKNSESHRGQRAGMLEPLNRWKSTRIHHPIKRVMPNQFTSDILQSLPDHRPPILPFLNTAMKHPHMYPQSSLNMNNDGTSRQQQLHVPPGPPPFDSLRKYNGGACSPFDSLAGEFTPSRKQSMEDLVPDSIFTTPFPNSIHVSVTNVENELNTETRMTSKCSHFENNSNSVGLMLSEDEMYDIAANLKSMQQVDKEHVQDRVLQDLALLKVLVKAQFLTSWNKLDDLCPSSQRATFP